MRVTVYTKPGCHLCEEVLVALDRLAPQYDLQVTEVNILEDMALYDAYHLEIPVVDIEEGRLGRLKAPISETDLRAAFQIARHAVPPAAARSVIQPRPEPRIDRAARYVGRHWLAFVSVVLGLFVGLPWLAPVFAALGWWDPANFIYTAYALTCHQLPERAGNIFGYQVAFCYRNTALYGGTFLFGLLYWQARTGGVRWLQWLRKPIPWYVALIFILPMAVDGITHMLGLRDSMLDMTMDSSFGSFYIGSQPFSLNWWLRITTGLLAALGVVWLAYPRMDRTVEESEAMRQAYALGQAAASPIPNTNRQ